MAGWSNVPAGKTKYDRLTRGGVTKFWSPGLLGLGGSYQTAATLNAQRQKEGLKPIDFTKIGVPKSKPAQPPASRPPAATPPASRPPAATPPASRPPAATPVAPKPAPVPFGKTMPAPASAALDKYKINKDWAAANPRLAQAQVKRAEQRASGKSAFDPEFRKSTINPILYKPGALKAEETMTKDSYDLVLEYLLSNGHADTILEAQYVMMQMSTEHIQSIINE